MTSPATRDSATLMRNGIMIIGEAWGEEETLQGRPFVGPAGWLLNTMLRMVGINRDDCFMTNVFNVQPHPTNDVSNLCGPKTEGIPGLPALSNGKYVRAQYASELARLYQEIASARPTLIICLGATAAWAVSGVSSIKKIRGTTFYSSVPQIDPPIKCICTYHPVAINREYSLRPVGLADLTKAAYESRFPDVRRPQRFIHIEPNYDDLLVFQREFIDPSPELSIDIETERDQITCIGFAPTENRALVVPIFDNTKPGRSYWSSLAEEQAVWHWIKAMCEQPKAVIVGQNFLYDMHFLWRRYGISVPSMSDDTMLLHHALQPEMEKGLGFLGSVYTDEQSWKFMRPKHDTVKQED